MQRAELRGLYAITPERQSGDDLLTDVAAVLKGGCRIVQYRDKCSPAPERVARALALRNLTQVFAAKLLINDDLALAHLVRADGVHLGKDDGNLHAARLILGPEKLIGASCYADPDAAKKAAVDGADYIAFGAAFPSLTKPAAPIATVDLFSGAKSCLPIPVCAIGGVTLDNAPSLIKAGVDLLAVITDLFSAPDIAARAATYQRLFEEHSA